MSLTLVESTRLLVDGSDEYGRRLGCVFAEEKDGTLDTQFARLRWYHEGDVVVVQLTVEGTNGIRTYRPCMSSRCISCLPGNPDVAVFHRVWTVRRAQRQGLSSYLHRVALAICAESGIKTVVCTVNYDNAAEEALLRKHGWSMAVKGLTGTCNLWNRTITSADKDWLSCDG